jgi:predicted transcriptional regulator
MMMVRMENMTIFDNRSRIYEYIKNTPGSHLRRISKELEIALGDTQHHLNTLEKSGSIKSKRMGMYKVYFSVSILEGRDESILATLQQETPREIILCLVEKPGSTQGEIAVRIGFSSPTINWHMSKLIEIGLVSRQRDRQSVRYYIKGNIKDITDLLKLYHPKIWNRLSSRIADLFLDLASITSKDTVFEPEADVYQKKKRDQSEEKKVHKKEDDP